MIKYSRVPQIDIEIEKQIAKLCQQSGYKIAAAESCTGGLIGHRITNQPGSSFYFLGSVVAYDYSVKRGILKVKPETLDRFGAVSCETALEMAAGTRAACSTEVPSEQVVGISVTGVAGPDGGTQEKPVGLVWIGVSCRLYDKAVTYTWDGNRLENKTYSAQAALNLLLDTLRTLNRYKDVQVKASVNFSGSLEPQVVLLNNQQYAVTAIGRQWEDDLGLHILVMVTGEKTLELVSCSSRWVCRPVSNLVRFG